MSSYHKSCKQSWRFSVRNNDHIRSKFGTCHDSSAVVTCANVWPDFSIIVIITATRIFTIFGYRLMYPLWYSPQVAALIEMKDGVLAILQQYWINIDRDYVRPLAICCEHEEGMPWHGHPRVVMMPTLSTLAHCRLWSWQPTVMPKTTKYALLQRPISVIT